jgi:hypothetical protein
MKNLELSPRKVLLICLLIVFGWVMLSFHLQTIALIFFISVLLVIIPVRIFDPPGQGVGVFIAFAVIFFSLTKAPLQAFFVSHGWHVSFFLYVIHVLICCLYVAIILLLANGPEID